MECLAGIYKWAFCISEPLFPSPYNFGFGGERDLASNKLQFESNFVRTSKYRWYDFLPSTKNVT